MDNIPESYRAGYELEVGGGEDTPQSYKVIITVIRDDETEIERDFIYHKDKDYNEEVANIINTIEKEF